MFNRIQQKLSERKLKFWTVGAVMCFDRGYDCVGCYYSTFFSDNHKCKMKAAALESVMQLGTPKEFFKKRSENYEVGALKTQQIIKEKKTMTEIAKKIVETELTMLDEKEKQIAELILDGKDKLEMMKILNVNLNVINPAFVRIYRKTHKLVNYQSIKNKKQEFLNYFLGGSSEPEEQKTVENEQKDEKTNILEKPMFDNPIVHTATIKEIKINGETVKPKNENNTLIMVKNAVQNGIRIANMQAANTVNNPLMVLDTAKAKYKSELDEVYLELGHGYFKTPNCFDSRIKAKGEKLIAKIQLLDEIIQDTKESLAVA